MPAQKSLDTEYVDAAEAAKILRKGLKESFPDTKFSVTLQRYSGGQSIHVKWEDGPSTALVNEITDQFRGTGVAGYDDYSPTNAFLLDGVPSRFGALYINVGRSYSDDVKLEALLQAAKKLGIQRHGGGDWVVEDFNSLYSYANEDSRLSDDVWSALAARSNVSAPKFSKELQRLKPLGNSRDNPEVLAQVAAELERKKSAETVESTIETRLTPKRRPSL